VAELQCSVLVKRKTILAHGGLCFRNVQKHVELHNIYQEKSHIELVFVESYKNFDTTYN